MTNVQLGEDKSKASLYLSKPGVRIEKFFLLTLSHLRVLQLARSTPLTRSCFAPSRSLSFSLFFLFHLLLLLFLSVYMCVLVATRSTFFSWGKIQDKKCASCHVTSACGYAGGQQQQERG